MSKLCEICDNIINPTIIGNNTATIGIRYAECVAMNVEVDCMMVSLKVHVLYVVLI